MIWTISDLHLSFAQPKPMDIFGAHWANHADRIGAAWQQAVHPDDWVLLAGDISWALKLGAALPDLAWIDALPGHKVLIRGNHDYWFPRQVGRIRPHLPASLSALGGDARDIDTAVVCGTRGWVTPNTPGFDPASDERIYQRELALLERALAAGQALTAGRPLIVLLHYPPFVNGQPTEFAQRIAAAGAAACLYGHLHRPVDWAQAVQGRVAGVDYQLTACDYLGFRPVAVRGLGPSK